MAIVDPTQQNSISHAFDIVKVLEHEAIPEKPQEISSHSLCHTSAISTSICMRQKPCCTMLLHLLARQAKSILVPTEIAIVQALRGGAAGMKSPMLQRLWETSGVASSHCFLRYSWLDSSTSSDHPSLAYMGSLEALA